MSRVDQEEWAVTLAQAGVRAVTISNVTNLPDIAAREIYRYQNDGFNPPSGQTPSDYMWFVKTKENSFHAALFLVLYRTVRPHVQTRGMAFCHAYMTYWRAVGSPLLSDKRLPLPAERANLLSKYAEDQKGMGRAGRSPIRTCKCRNCGTLFVGLTDRSEPHCHFCRDDRSA